MFEGEVGEWVQLLTGVRQGWVLLPVTFALVVDWAMARVALGGDGGLERMNGDMLRKLDYTDDRL